MIKPDLRLYTSLSIELLSIESKSSLALPLYKQCSYFHTEF